MIGGILTEVRDFLSGLNREHPEVFAPPKTHVAVFHERATLWAERMGVKFGRIRVKNQRSLWGSCTPDGNLNFNWRLTLAPPEVLDYVVIHELAHRAEMNHSPRFWAIVERYCPEQKERRRWLRKNGQRLFTIPSASAGVRPESHSPSG